MPEPIGVSVYKNNSKYGDYFFLRFLLRASHLEQLGKPGRISIRGLPENGFILAPDNKRGLTPSPISSKKGGGGFYLQTRSSKAGLSDVARTRIEMMPAVENGHLRVPAFPDAWINGKEFEPNGVYGEVAKTSRVSSFAGDEPVRMNSTTGMVVPGGATSPVPKAPGPVYQIPADATLAALQAELAAKLAECKAIVAIIEDRTGLKLVLDRHFRLQVALT